MIWPLIIGLGSHHGDDQAGWLVLERLRARRYPQEKLFRIKHPADLLDVVEEEQDIVICDAIVGRGNSGRIHRFRWPTDMPVYRRSWGSHDLSLGDVLLLGRLRGRFPEAVQIWAVEGQAWSAGSEPSDVVVSAAAHLADLIWNGREDE